MTSLIYTEELCWYSSLGLKGNKLGNTVGAVFYPNCSNRKGAVRASEGAFDDFSSGNKQVWGALGIGNRNAALEFHDLGSNAKLAAHEFGEKQITDFG